MCLYLRWTGFALRWRHGFAPWCWQCRLRRRKRLRPGGPQLSRLVAAAALLGLSGRPRLRLLSAPLAGGAKGLRNEPKSRLGFPQRRLLFRDHLAAFPSRRGVVRAFRTVTDSSRQRGTIRTAPRRASTNSGQRLASYPDTTRMHVCSNQAAMVSRPRISDLFGPQTNED